MNQMDHSQKERARNSLIGAFVADAATMGMHWLYSQPRILKVVPTRPEFRDPNPEDFEGNVGYFAHGDKVAGEFSHYGEQAWVMLQSLVTNEGHYEKYFYQETFRNHFGYGGRFNGYIDRPTRETLDTIYRSEHEALQRADAIPFEGDPKQKSGILIKILAGAKRYGEQRLKDEAAKITASLENPKACLGYAMALIKALDGGTDFPGARDEQLPAISKLPALIARYADAPELNELATSAIKMTNNTPRAINYGLISTAVLSSLVNGGTVVSAIESGLQAANSENRDHLSTVLSRDCSISDLTTEFGLHCDLGSGMASLLYNLRTSSGYVDGIRSNIYAGGDNCGRSIMLGAALGAVYGLGGEQGIPEEWISKVQEHQTLLDDIDRLLSH